MYLHVRVYAQVKFLYAMVYAYLDFDRCRCQRVGAGGPPQTHASPGNDEGG